MIKVLHVIHAFSLRGIARSVIAAAQYSAQQAKIRHRLISLTPAEPDAILLAREAGIEVVHATDRETLENTIGWADVVHLHWWNTPEIYDFLRSELPPMRFLVWFYAAGDVAPQMITNDLIAFADFAVASSLYSYDLPVFRNLPENVRLEKTAMAYDAVDLAHVADLKPKPHATFNVGYFEHADLVRTYPRFVPMHSAIDIPDIRFIVCGSGRDQELRQEAQHLGTSQRFDFRRELADVRSVIEVLDVYGSPPCEGSLPLADLCIQKVMLAGIPPVVFAEGRIGRLIAHGFSGLLVHSELEYQHAIEHLYHHPEERARLGRNAQEYARQLFGAENAALRLKLIYEQMVQKPKRERIWGSAAEEGLLGQVVSLRDLTGEPMSGSERFIESLGAAGADFHVSLRDMVTAEILAAERRIASSSPLLSSAVAGGIDHYGQYYPEDAELRFWSGLAKLGQDRYDEALLQFSKAQQLGFTHWRLDWYRSQAALREGVRALAEQALMRVNQVAPDFLDAALALVDLWIENGRYISSIEVLDAVLHYHPDTPEALKRLGICRHALGAGDTAERQLRLALANDPADPDLLFSLGDLSLGSGNAMQALHYFQAATSLLPSDVEAWLGVATAALQIRDRTVYQHAVQQACALDPSHPQLVSLADAAWATG
jgi:Flp pilus assembly protein TadD/glycosyltransferase involved in cell wall biosynthesis